MAVPETKLIAFDRQRALSDDVYWIESLLSVNTKNQTIIPFKLNGFQRFYMDWRARSTSGRRVIVKSRQITCSTIIKAKNLKKAVTIPATKILTMTHHDEATQLFRLVVREWCHQLENLRMLPPVEKDSDDILSFKGLNSSMIFTTAGGKLGGRAATYTTVHASEIAHWPKDPGPIIGSILPSIPQFPAGEIDMESSPKGAAGPLYEYYGDAKIGANEWDYTFWEWWKQEEYRRRVPQGFEPTIEESRLLSKHHLDLEQIAWRRWTKQEMKRTATLGIQDSGGLFPQEYPEDDISCFMAGTDIVIDSEALTTYIARIEEPFVSEEGWDIWEKWQPGDPYVITADPSRGKSDWGAAHIINFKTNSVVARLHVRVIPSHFTDLLYKGAKMYGLPLMVIETPGPGEEVIGRIQSPPFNYPNLYYHLNEVTGKISNEPGWPQNQHTRTLVIGALQHWLNACALKCGDERTVREMTSLTWHRAGQLKRIDRAEAAIGTHDDLALSLGIGLAVRDEVMRLHNMKSGVGVKRAMRIDQGYMMGERGSPFVGMDANGQELVTPKRAVSFWG